MCPAAPGHRPVGGDGAGNDAAEVDADHPAVPLEGEVAGVVADDDGGVVEDVVEPAALGDDRVQTARTLLN